MTPEEQEAMKEELTKRLADIVAIPPVTLPPVEVPQIDNSIDLDDDDKIRLENIQLKERCFKLESDNARNSFYARLVKKHNIDIVKYAITVDAQAKKILLNPK